MSEKHFFMCVVATAYVAIAGSVSAQTCEPEWSALTVPGGTGVSGPVRALTVYDDGSGQSLYAGGVFATAGGMKVNNIARWNGSSWSALFGPDGTGMNVVRFAPDENALTVFDDGTGAALYAGGPFTTAGGVTVNYIARWDGSSWSALTGPKGTGMSGVGFPPPLVTALTVFDDGMGPALYAGGFFATAGGLTVNKIARWDGSSWSALTGPGGTGMSSGVSPYVSALTVFDDGTGPALYAGGAFPTAGGVTVNSIARWDGSSWSALTGPGGTGVDGTVRALTVFDDGSGPALYVGGLFPTAGGVTVNNIARWDGSSWSALTSPGGTGVSGGWVRAMTVFDDGKGPALYAGGNFHTAGGLIVNLIARWDGSEWSALTGTSGTGMNGDVSALSGFDDGSGPVLYVGGQFTTAGGLVTNRIARWGCPTTPPVCLGDIADSNGVFGNSDGVVDYGDFVALLGLIGPCDGGTPGCLGDIADDFGFTAADGGGPDGFVDFGDFVALLGLIGPCP